jgi:hypothetical protein
MRLRLMERLRRLVGWRFGSQRNGNGRGDTGNALADVGGRHRRSAAGGPRPGRRPVAAAGRETSPPPLQPPAGLPKRSPRATGPIPRTPAIRANGAAMPPMPRNYTPRAGADRGGGGGGGIGRARIREAPMGAAPMETAARPQQGPDAAAAAAPRQPWYQVVGDPAAARRVTGQAGLTAQAAQAGLTATGNGAAAAQAQQASGYAATAAEAAAVQRNAGHAADPRALLPLARPHAPGQHDTRDGRRNCGPLERILWRQWDATAAAPPPQVVASIDRLAEFPRQLQEKLAAGLDGIYVGAGGVPDLDHMTALHGVPLPSGKATWDACAGAYGERKIVVGTRPSPTPDVMCHEVGHALDDLDSPPGKWQSDSAEFRLIYDQCQPYIASDFHRQRGGLGRKEFFADSFAAIASAQRPALVDMLSGNTRIALRVMLYFNRRYGI